MHDGGNKMNHISEDYFMTGMSPRQAWGYIEQLQNTIDKYENRIYEMVDIIEKLDAENKELKEAAACWNQGLIGDNIPGV